MKRCLVLAPIACLLALAAVTPASAQAPTQMPVTFDLSASTCSQLPTGTTIHGTGTASFSATSGGHLHTVVDFTSSDLESADVLAIKQIHGDPIGCDPI